MKAFKTIIMIFVLGGLITAIFGCGAKSDGTSANQIANVKRGSLTLDITAAGNLAFSYSEDLVADLFYGTSGVKGTIGEVFVQEGDYVEEGQVLVTIDTSEWDTHVAALEDQVTSAERAILQAQINLKNAEQAVKNAEQAVKNAKDNVVAKETTVLNAEISYQQAQTAMAASIGTIDTQAALAELRKAQRWYDYVTTTYGSLSTTTWEDYMLTLQEAEERLTAAQTNYDNILSGYDAAEIAIKKIQVQIAKNNLDAAKKAVDAAKQAVEDASNDVTLKQMSLQLSQSSLEDAQKALEEEQQNLLEAQEMTQEMSPEIKAPFSGFIIKINVAVGDEIKNGAVVVTIVDPSKFEADILVSEMDISQVNIGSVATVTPDAMSELTYSARVTHIAPTATIQSGVVNYNVTVELDDTEPMNQSQTTTGLPQTGGFTPSDNITLPEGFTPPEGFQRPENFTPPEGTEFPDMSGEGFTPPEGVELPDVSSSSVQSQNPSVASVNFELREGLTVTVSIIMASRTNVLIVPNGAVITEGSKSYVEVVSVSGTTEKREVKTGISDWQYTEITEGLSEGEQVIVSQTTSSSTSSSERPDSGMFFMGG